MFTTNYAFKLISDYFINHSIPFEVSFCSDSIHIRFICFNQDWEKIDGLHICIIDNNFLMTSDLIHSCEYYSHSLDSLIAELDSFFLLYSLLPI